MAGPNIIIDTERERIERVLGSYWLPYQQRWIDDESRNKLCEKTRRCGLTFAEEFRRVQRIVTQGARYDAYVTSRDEGLAKQFIREAKQFAGVFNAVAEDIGEVAFDKEKGISAYALEAATGKRIYSLTSNPDTQAGRAGDRTADEFALHKDQRQLYAIMRPGTAWGGQLSLFSTHRGKQSFFNSLFTEVQEKGNPKKFSVHRITIEDAVRDGLWIKIKSLLPDDDEQKLWSDDEWLQSLRDSMPDESSYLQEYMCVPEDDADSFLTWEMITSCAGRLVCDGTIDWRSLPGPFYLGYDIARKKDLSVITLLHQIGPMLVQVHMEVMQKVSFTNQQRILHTMLEDKRIKKACIDCTGLGAMLAEQAAEKFGKGRVQEVTFSLPVKHELAHPMKKRFEDRTVLIADDIKLHADLRSIKTKTTSSGSVMFISEGGETDGHADRFWSLALAVHAAETLTNPGIFQRLQHLINQGRRDPRASDRRDRRAF